MYRYHMFFVLMITLLLLRPWMETLGIKYGTKKMQKRATEIVNHMVP